MTVITQQPAFTLNINPLYFKLKFFAKDLPSDLCNRALDICHHYGYNFDYIHFKRTGINTFEMYHCDVDIWYTLFIAENEID